MEKSAVKELKDIPKEFIPSIVKAVQNLSFNPFPTNVKKLRSSHKTYRLRSGDYRIIFEVLERELVIKIIRVRHRKDIYRKQSSFFFLPF